MSDDSASCESGSDARCIHYYPRDWPGLCPFCAANDRSAAAAAAVLFLKRAAHGGSIVSLAALTPEQIAIARSADRVLVTDDGLGFVYVPGAVGLTDIDADRAARAALEQRAAQACERPCGDCAGCQCAAEHNAPVPGAEGRER